jgi:hypothetical protein
MDIVQYGSMVQESVPEVGFRKASLKRSTIHCFLCSKIKNMHII